MNTFIQFLIRCFVVSVILYLPNVHAMSLPDTIQAIRPSIVGIGTYSRLSDQHSRYLGTGFVIKDGSYVATNAHVIPEVLNEEAKEQIAVYVGRGAHPKIRFADVVAIDQIYDIAILKIPGEPLKPLTLSAHQVREGEQIAFTGYPIGAVLGLYPVTHRGIVSCITPVVTPARTSRELTVNQIKRLRHPYMVYQLDATAYPGNSGSPVYEVDTGNVVAIVNKVLVKTTKEAILSDPSAITYAIPIKHLIALARNAK
ncbi:MULTISPECIES: S1 family peptidase [Vibrio]|uniref:Trypsin-like serine protease n=2 Tax=Vibrio TaxID=662 RepID=A0A7X4LQU1_9VIBR|nr:MULTISPECIES: serine protease [Vibrio]MBF9002135.1 trypsin-like peptidase domain-containing protein [Vibrio nitrifigilis]MZI96106.1 trypsin-like serine protease [Vibrio eleionomae]